MIRESLRTVQLGIKSLLLHKLRSALTTLGLLFGVASVIAMLAVGEGANYEALERIKAMGSTNILIRSKKPPSSQESSSQNIFSARRYGLTYNDAEMIEATLADAEHVVSVRETVKDLRRASQWASGVVVGTTPEFLTVVNMSIAEGRWLTPVDIGTLANVAVLGAGAARALFPLENPIGATLQAGDRFTVVGVLDYLGRTSGTASGVSLDDCIFIPITSSRKRFGDETTIRSGGSFSRERVELHEVKVKLATTEEVLPAAAVLRTMIKDSHTAQDDVAIDVPLELLKEAEATAAIFNVVLGSIAVISLLVGGIGIMNVMLATVTERTREIGIRRALGAKKVHIVYQFLVETVVLSGAGGIIGVGLGLLLPILVTAFSDQLTIIRVHHVALAFGVSAFVGVAAGIYPAWRAANMDPVEALRHE
jgi:putative ABC transport system permease protein